MTRFEQVDYDARSEQQSIIIRAKFQDLEKSLDKLVESRTKSLALTHLEIAFMWVGKTIRDEQVARNMNASLQRK